MTYLRQLLTPIPALRSDKEAAGVACPSLVKEWGTHTAFGPQLNSQIQALAHEVETR